MPAPLRLGKGDLAAVLPPGMHVYVSSCAAESDLLLSEVELAGVALGKARFSGIFVAGLNKGTWNAGSQSAIVTFFQTPEIRAEGPRGTFLPLCYQDIVRWYASNPPDVVMVMLTPPDANGLCSFGVDAGFGPDLWRNAKFCIAHINPAMPRAADGPAIPFADLTAFFEEEQPLRTMASGGSDAISDAIARNVADFVEDGMTIQVGLGKLPDAVLDRLHDRRRMKIHSGLGGDGVLRLVRSGAVAADTPAVIGSAIGSAELYAALSEPAFAMRPVSVTHDPAALANTARLVTINSVMSVDLFGQGYAEASSRGFLSGPGGASDFARGARVGKDGLRIVALPSTAKGQGRIVPPRDAFGPVSLSRFDIDVVVTEHGAADLRGKSHDGRARELIAVASPLHRDALEQAWAETARTI
ncbi:acetyl-CoA hydrolase/transferase family protein [Croceicoccus bisphenolivorans]|uniref:acetyl-CoA hydrolase/transferase family protein n=1 Tax=Croceicoccus bisphenolivorans TaxID=1783232 RepID=UPI0009EEBBFA|nr:acetyl-CoA hydrolase/transferase C-terminal domain-containing protein [Croceicoccus bisphenolivorans]